jgi:hypothetical protein
MIGDLRLIHYTVYYGKIRFWLHNDGTQTLR